MHFLIKKNLLHSHRCTQTAWFRGNGLPFKDYVFESRKTETFRYRTKFSPNRMSNEVEIKYWPTELEIVGLIWVIRKIRHMIESAKQINVILIDHTANISIVKQTTFANNNTDKLNFRLIRASIYLSQFRLNVKYRPGKKHVIPDVLSRLFSGNRPVKLPRRNPAEF